MQSNKQITDTSKTTVKQAILDNQDNVNALRSSNSGASFPSDPIAGMHCYRTDTNKMYMYDGSNWVEEVDVNNNQQISGAKTFTGKLEASTVNAATLSVSGAATVPTPNADNNSKTVATTAFVKTAIANLVNGAPSQLDTLKELSAALGNDANFSATVAKKIGEKVSKSGDTITGPILYDKTPNDDSELPNKAYVDKSIKAAVESTKREVDNKISKAHYYLSRNTAYKVGDIAYSPNLPSYLYLECTTAGTTGATEPNMSTLSGGVIVNDGTAKFSAKTVCAKEYVEFKNEDLLSKIAYRAGDTYSLNSWYTIPGNVSNSGRDIFFVIPTSKTILAKKMRIDELKITVRQNNKYLIGDASNRVEMKQCFTQEEYTESNKSMFNCGIYIQLRLDSAPSGIINNNPLSVVLGNVRIYFYN